jgi:hypothetical protein
VKDNLPDSKKPTIRSVFQGDIRPGCPHRQRDLTQGAILAARHGWAYLLVDPGDESHQQALEKQKGPVFRQALFVLFGGEGGIRTLDTLPYTHFPGVLLQPLGHLTNLF